MKAPGTGLRVLLAAALLLVLTGCRLAQTPTPVITETAPAVVLSARQIRILEQAGLPTEYAQLSLTQKSAIESIEDMLCYLEQRYDDRFEYVGYVADSPVEREHLLASSAAYPDCGPVTVYRTYENGSFVYEDDYAALRARPLYEQALNDRIALRIPEDRFIVFSDVSEAEDGLGQEDVLARASATSYVYIDREVCTEADLRALAEDFGPWIRDQAQGAQASLTLFYLAAPEDLAAADSETYLDLLPRLRDNPHVSCSLSQDGWLKLDGEPFAPEPGKDVEPMLQLKLDDTVLQVDWEDNASVDALRALCADGPLVIEMSMYGGFEQVGPIGATLPADDVQITTAPGDLVLYASDQLVVFYGSNSWAYTRLGHITHPDPDALAGLLGSGDVTLTLTLVGE